jgi:hypothetical protein
MRDGSTVARSFARRQQIRRLRRAVRRAAQGVVALAAALVLGQWGSWSAAAVTSIAGAGALLASLRALRLAGRSRVGANSEAQVRRVLADLVRDGWQARHAVDWTPGGDLDHVVRAPSGIGFVVETKTSRYVRAHVDRTVAAARWLARRRRRYPLGVVPVVCVTRARWVERVEHGALIVSLDRLLPALRASAALAAPAAAAN